MYVEQVHDVIMCVFCAVLIVFGRIATLRLRRYEEVDESHRRAASDRRPPLLRTLLRPRQLSSATS